MYVYDKNKTIPEVDNCKSPVYHQLFSSLWHPGMKDFKIEIVITFRNIYRVLPNQFLSYVADPPRGFASHLEKVMKRQWGSRRDTKSCYLTE